MDKVNRSNIFLFLHERHEAAVFGLNNNFWYLSTTGKNVATKSIMDMPLRRTIHQYTTGVDIEEYVKCEQKSFSNNLNLSSVCWAPMFDAALSYAALGTDYSLRPCRIYNEFGSTFFDIMAAMNVLGEEEQLGEAEQRNGCQTSKMEMTFETELRQSMAPLMGFTEKSGMTSICIYYDSRQVQIEEEYVLMDMSSLTSSIGGVIGAILGWSILDFVKFCIRRFCS